MIKTFVGDYSDVRYIDKAVSEYLKELKSKGTKYTVQTSAAGNGTGIYYFVTVISE